MADQMDVDSDALPDDTRLNDKAQTKLRARVGPSMAQKRDRTNFTNSQEDENAAIANEGLGSCSPKQPVAKKPKVSLKREQLSSLFGLSSSSPDSQQHQQGIDFETLLACLQEAEAKVDTLQKENEGFAKEKRKAERKMKRFQDEIESAEEANEMLERLFNDTAEKHEHLITQFQLLRQHLETKQEDHRKEVAQYKAHISNLTQSKDRLRQMIVPISEKDVPDSAAMSKFGTLCSSILALVRQTWTTEVRGDFDLRRLSGYQREFFRSQLPPSYDRIRSLVFQIMHSTILSSQGYFLGGDYERLEQHIRSVEKDLSSSLSGDRGRVIEWRNATFKATESFRDNNSRLSSTAQEQIWDLLSPLKTKDAAAEQSGRERLKAICVIAVEFSLMIRQLKDDFAVDNLANAVNEHFSQWDWVAEDFVSVPACEDARPGTIAYVVTGALIKRPKENPEKVLVLQKAQVAVFT